MAADAVQSRALLVGETLRAAAPSPEDAGWLTHEARRLDTPFLLYRDGELAAASDPLLAALAPTGRFLTPDVELALVIHDEVSQSRSQALGRTTTLFGYRTVESSAGPVVLAAPARADDVPLDRRRRDLGILVLFSTAVGALAAFWLSGVAARTLAGPIRALRQAALALAAGGRAPALEDNPTVEFRPVFAAFRRMASDLEASRAATAHAERVLAWGEMARQVAHEIKNPLTPIRLGVQHLQRARADRRVDFDRVLDENVARILAEIDHLDEIARAFSRYGAVPSERPAAEPTDVAAVLRDLIGLERMGEAGITWGLDGADGRQMAMAQRDELREVLLNVYENAHRGPRRRARHPRRPPAPRVRTALLHPHQRQRAGAGDQPPAHRGVERQRRAEEPGGARDAGPDHPPAGVSYSRTRTVFTLTNSRRPKALSSRP
ncbi:MAG: hypothetical protein B7Z72_10210 [Gemmatimonadetes bacterium 21-71-4]|nr:MAG: hypothetical protein B7Z72_10210 [Gemmatimonadetes bacterium 21-71-4]